MEAGTPTKIVRFIRAAVVFAVGAAITVLLSLLIVLIIRDHIAKGMAVDGITATLIGCMMISGILIWLCCLAAYHALSFWRTTRLDKAIRLSEAMQMLHAHTHPEKIEAIKHYAVRVFKSKAELPHGNTENVECKEISTFLSPMFFRIDRLNAIGSPHYCCDFEQIECIIADNKAKWGSGEEQSGGTSADIIALERTIADLREKNKETTSKYTAASGREGRLKKQQTETNSHIATLIELANKVTNEFKPPRTITRDEVKAKYLTIGKLHGINEAPGEYVELFRKTMPKEIINWSGAPNQGSEEGET